MLSFLIAWFIQSNSRNYFFVVVVVDGTLKYFVLTFGTFLVNDFHRILLEQIIQL
jgi:hypothetical protein